MKPTDCNSKNYCREIIKKELKVKALFKDKTNKIKNLRSNDNTEFLQITDLRCCYLQIELEKIFIYCLQ